MPEVSSADEARALGVANLLRVPALDRDRPQRKVLLPIETALRFALWSFSVIFVLIYAGVVSWASAQVELPDLMGMQQSEALEVLDDLGLRGAVAGQRANSAPEGQVIQQIPVAGTTLAHNDSVSFYLSAGLGGFEVPDLIGYDLTATRLDLQRKGIFVVVEGLQSEELPGTILLTTPPAGTTIYDTSNHETGALTLYVATPVMAAGLQEFELTGLNVVIEPRYTTTPSGDITFDVARRLSSLFEASDANVTITRGFTEREVTREEYAERAARENPELHIILTVRNEGAAGITIRTSDTDENASGPLIYERMQANQLEPRLIVAESFGQATNRHNVEVVLGVTYDVNDLENFTENFWRDHVARAIYMGAAPTFDLAW